MTSCVSSIPYTVEGGTFELNDRLRRDMRAAENMPDREYLANGSCRLDASPTDNCAYISPVLTRYLLEGNPEWLGQLRRADNLWLPGGGDQVRLSWELMATDVAVMVEEQSPQIVARNITTGSCFLFPGLDPERFGGTEMRGPIQPFAENTIAGNFAGAFSVILRACHAGTSAGISTVDNLAPESRNCSDVDVTSLVGEAQAPPPQNRPLCVLNVPEGIPDTDVTYSLVPSFRSDLDVDPRE